MGGFSPGFTIDSLVNTPGTPQKFLGFALRNPFDEYVQPDHPSRGRWSTIEGARLFTTSEEALTAANRLPTFTCPLDLVKVFEVPGKTTTREELRSADDPGPAYPAFDGFNFAVVEQGTHFKDEIIERTHTFDYALLAVRDNVRLGRPGTRIRRIAYTKTTEPPQRIAEPV